MSDSTPAKKTPADATRPAPASADSAPHRPRRRDTTVGWTLLSILLHAGLLGLLLLFPPVRQALFDRTPKEPSAEIRVEGEKLTEVTRQLRTVHEQDLRSMVRELDLIRQEMEQIQAQKMEEFRQFNRDRAQTAPEEALAAIDEALQAQAQALAKQQDSQQKPEEFDKLRTDAGRDQSAAETAQGKAIDLLEVLGDRIPQHVKDAQRQAADEQAKATLANALAREARRAAQAAEDQLRKREADLTKAQAEHKKNTELNAAAAQTLSDTQSALAKAQEELADAHKQHQSARSALDRARQAVADAKTVKDSNAVKMAEAAAGQADRDEKSARKSMDSQQGKVSRLTREAQQAASRAEQLRAATTKAQAAVEQAGKSVEHARQNSAERSAAAERAATQSTQQQERAIESQKSARDRTAGALSQSDQSRPSPPDTSDAPGPQDTDLSALDLADLYHKAVESEKQIAEAFKDVRATELAVITGRSLNSARQNVEVPDADRPDLDARALRRDVTQPDEFKKNSEQIQTALRETGSMVAAGSNMLEAARAMVRKSQEGTGLDLEQMRAEAERAAAIAKASHEVEGGKSSDLTALMAGKPGGAAGSVPGGPARSEPGGGRKDGSDGTESDTTNDRKLPPVAQMPPQISDKLPFTPARKFIAGHGGEAWAAVTSWYLLGPFPNPARANIHRGFPPESVIDLDAVYPGMNGPIRWEFVQSPNAYVSPRNWVEYGIWYAYTELEFDQPRDLWIAVGSDDRSDLWINGTRVWSSSDSLKAWRIGEGLRKVHFQKGRNRVLYRIENGWGGLGFSMLIHTGPSPTPGG